MSLGDGKATSIGRNGRTVIYNIADGSAYVTAVNNDERIIYIEPSTDADSLFDCRLNIINNKSLYKIKFNECNINVENSFRDYIKSIEFSNNTMQVFNLTSPFYNSQINVIDKSDKQNKLLGYLQFKIDDVNPCTIQAYSADKYIITDSGVAYSISIPKVRKELLSSVIEDKIVTPIQVVKKDVIKPIFNDLTIMVENKMPSVFANNLVISPLYIPVEDYKPPNIGVITAGGALKGFRLVIQKYSYLEQYLSFSDKSVKEITGLPQGMVYENGYLKGSPTVSGRYSIMINMDDNTSMSGLIVVTQVPRNL